MSLLCSATILGMAALSGAGGCLKANVFFSPPPPEVRVMKPSREVVTRYDEFTGRTDPREVVEVRAGSWVHMPPNLPHAVRATEPSAMVLVLLLG